MLNGNGNESMAKESIGLNSKKETTMWNNYYVKLPSYMFYRGNVICVPVRSFSLPLIFTLVAASISHFLSTAINFHVFISSKFISCFQSRAKSSSFSAILASVDIEI